MKINIQYMFLKYIHAYVYIYIMQNNYTQHTHIHYVKTNFKNKALIKIHKKINKDIY